MLDNLLEAWIRADTWRCTHTEACGGWLDIIYQCAPMT
eukprot:COSAG01_NODE_70996_length_257_cov_0.651899_1_plen_37_part_01